MRAIIYTRTDGGLSVVRPTISRSDPPGFTEAKAEQRAWNRLPQDAINPQFIDPATLPADRSVRNAWRQSGATVTIDPAIAAQIVAARVRMEDDATEQAAVKADAQVQTFLNFSPAQLDNWVDNNIIGAATLGALRTACGTAFKVLGRIALAAGRGKFLR